MTDQPTPRTAAGRALLYQSGISDFVVPEDILAVEAEAAAQARTDAYERGRVDMFNEMGAKGIPLARTEALDVDALREALSMAHSLIHSGERCSDYSHAAIEHALAAKADR